MAESISVAMPPGANTGDARGAAAQLVVEGDAEAGDEGLRAAVQGLPGQRREAREGRHEHHGAASGPGLEAPGQLGGEAHGGEHVGGEQAEGALPGLVDGVAEVGDARVEDGRAEGGGVGVDGVEQGGYVAVAGQVGGGDFGGDAVGFELLGQGFEAVAAAGDEDGVGAVVARELQGKLGPEARGGARHEHALAAQGQARHQ
jgi:hypothetical protein